MTLVFQQHVAASTEKSSTMQDRQTSPWTGPAPSKRPTNSIVSEKISTPKGDVQVPSNSPSSQTGSVRPLWEDFSWKDADFFGRLCVCPMGLLVAIFFASLFISFYGSILYDLWHLVSWLFAWYTRDPTWCPAAPSLPAQAQLVHSAVPNSFRFNVVKEGQNVTIDCPNYLLHSGGSYMTCWKL